MPEKTFIIIKSQSSIRLDKFIALQIPYISRSQAKRIIQENKVLVNNNYAVPAYLLKPEDEIKITLPGLFREEILKPYPLEIPIIYEDRHLLVINKPVPLTVHPAHKGQQNTLVNALIFMDKKLSSIHPLRPGIVHRLDKETSGIMLIAKTNAAHLKLTEEFKNRRVEKEYIAVIHGRLKQEKGRVELPLRTQPHLQKTKITFIKSKPASTFYEVIEERGGYSLIKVFPKTGRMHQIRAHMAFLGYPILGDIKYGGEKFNRLCLHARRIKFFHPGTGELMEFTAPSPFNLEKICNKA